MSLKVLQLKTGFIIFELNNQKYHLELTGEEVNLRDGNRDLIASKEGVSRDEALLWAMYHLMSPPVVKWYPLLEDVEAAQYKLEVNGQVVAETTDSSFMHEIVARVELWIKGLDGPEPVSQSLKVEFNEIKQRVRAAI